jgi:hypothetical protein
MSTLFAVGVVPQLDALLKIAMLGIIVVVISVIDGLIAVPAGIAISRRVMKSATWRRRVVAGVLITLAIFAFLWIAEATVGLLILIAYIPTNA